MTGEFSERAEVYRSGMSIAAFDERDVLDQKLGEAYVAWYTSFGGRSDIEWANQIAYSMAEVDGIELIEPGDYGQHARYRCVQYAFGVCKGEPWAIPYEDDWVHSDLWHHPLAFLAKNGYLPVDTPQPDDVAAYTCSSQEELQEGWGSFEHFGIVQEDGLIVSKIAQGPVVRHRLELVPTSFGNTVYFFRKTDA
jgi:hypothetical protein